MPPLPIDSAAKLLGIAPTTLWRRIRAGDLIAQQESGSGEWLVDLSLHEIRLAAESETEPPPTLDELTQLVGSIQRQSELLHAELDAYEREADGLRQLRDTLRATLTALLGTAPVAPSDAEAASSPRPDPAPSTPDTQTPPPLTRPIAPGNISAPPADDVAFPSDIIAHSVLEAARERLPRDLADSPHATTSEPDEPTDFAPHSAFINIGFQMHAIESGSPDAPSLLLLHTLGGDAHNFDTLASALQSDFHCLALDLRGHGDTAWADDGNYRLSTHVQALDHFIQARGLSDLAIVGTGFGADLALAYAGARPDTVDHLVLHEPSPNPTAPGLARVHQQLQETPARFDDLTAAAAWARQYNPSLRDLPDSAAGSLISSHFRTLDDGGVGWKFDPALRDLDPTALRDVDLFAAVQRVPCPVLLIRATQSDLLPTESAERLLKLCPNAELLEIATEAEANAESSVMEASILTTGATLAAVQRFLQGTVRD